LNVIKYTTFYFHINVVIIRVTRVIVLIYLKISIKKKLDILGPTKSCKTMNRSDPARSRRFFIAYILKRWNKKKIWVDVWYCKWQLIIFSKQSSECSDHKFIYKQAKFLQLPSFSLPYISETIKVRNLKQAQFFFTFLLCNLCSFQHSGGEFCWSGGNKEKIILSSFWRWK